MVLKQGDSNIRPCPMVPVCYRAGSDAQSPPSKALLMESVFEPNDDWSGQRGSSKPCAMQQPLKSLDEPLAVELSDLGLEPLFCECTKSVTIWVV